jgi:hypothetical protein
MLELFGGPDRDRTDDLFHAMEARSQLRHRPTCCKDATLLLSPLGSDSSNPWRNMTTLAANEILDSATGANSPSRLGR